MTSKQEILEELRRSRVAIARDTTSIAEEIDIVSKIRRSVKTRPLAWLGSAAALGYILAGPKTRKVPSPAKKGGKSEKSGSARTGRQGFFSILFQLAKFLLPLLRPALSAYAAQRLGELSSRIPR
ncbi:MAG: hypothetical protein ACKOEZ_09865 [Spartobacteria bacterium]